MVGIDSLAGPVRGGGRGRRQRRPPSSRPPTSWRRPSTARAAPRCSSRGTPTSPTRSTPRSASCSCATRRAPADIEATLRSAAARSSSTARAQAMDVGEPDRARAPRAHHRRRRRDASRSCATPARCSSARGRPRPSATTSPGSTTCSPPHAPRGSPARCASTRSASTSTSCASRAEGLDAVAEHVAGARRPPRGFPRTAGSVTLRRSSAFVAGRADERQPRGLVAPRDDLRALEGYHSPQLDVSVRLNTNESPYAPPEEFVDRMARRAAQGPPEPLSRPRRAPISATRSARQLGQPPERLFCANGSNEVLQTLLLAYGGPGRRRRCSSPRTRSHAHIARITGTEVVVGERRADYTIDPDAACALVAEHAAPRSCSCAAPTTPRARSRPARPSRRCSTRPTASSSSTRRTASSRPRARSAQVRDDGRLVVVRTYSKVWSMAALRLGFAVAPPWVVEQLEKVVLPYHLAAPTQIAGTVALELRSRDGERGSTRLVAERERMRAELATRRSRHRGPVGCELRACSRCTATATRSGRSSSTAACSCATSRAGPGFTNCLRVTIGTPDENDAFLAALRESLREVAA